jgi:hypothetical protein
MQIAPFLLKLSFVNIVRMDELSDWKVITETTGHFLSSASFR